MQFELSKADDMNMFRDLKNKTIRNTLRGLRWYIIIFL